MVSPRTDENRNHVADQGVDEAGGSAPAGRRFTIAAKLGIVMGAMTALLVLVSGILFVQLQQVTRTYDDILASEVQSGLQARKMQVEFKKQVQEWKDILLRGFNPDDLATYTRQFRDESAVVDALSTEVAATTRDDVVRSEIEQFRTEHANLNRAYDAALAPFVAAGARDPRVPDRAVRGQDRPPTDRIDRIVDRIETTIADRTAAQRSEVAARQQVLFAVGVAALLLVLTMLGFVIAGIVRPIRTLTRQAYSAAHNVLPDTIGEIRSMPADAEPPRVSPIQVGSRDELGDLAGALTSIQASAVQLALDQHRAERESAEMLINLGRRNQGLLKRTLGYISELEASEREPDTLAKLFRLDHATTRIRRNAESMLVLAGAGQTRTWPRPVPVAEAVRAALSEIEDYTRVDLYHIEDAALTGAAVADVVHLLAELTENATHFSPPSTRVTVVGQHIPEAYRIRIIDQGIGMTHAEVVEANGRIVGAGNGRADSPLLGLYVVGRLAARRGISVVLEPSAGPGITATITLPMDLLAEPSATPTQTGEPAAQSTTQLIPHPRATPSESENGQAGALAMVEGPRKARHAAPSHAAPAAVVPNGVAPFATTPLPAVSAGTRHTASSSHTGSTSHIGRYDTPEDGMGWFDPAPGRNGNDREMTAADGVRIPQRVRGAQLPDLGPVPADESAFDAPDPDQVLSQLSALASGVEAARAVEHDAEVSDVRRRSRPASDSARQPGSGRPNRFDPREMP